MNNINWHKDYVSGFIYPLKRIDKIKISDYFDKGIDIKFPWELSRFNFGIELAQRYIITNNIKYYHKFKKILKYWLDENPFCYGINWYCTMEVAIRVINWIVALNIFISEFEKDVIFKKIIIKSLVQHAEYISAFPEIYQNGHTTNHTTADYVGLLFLSLTLKEHPKSVYWLKQSISGLEKCIKYQTYEDGVNFEGSISYHRLVLEMFAYSAIIARANSVKLSKKYYELLFKMFEYSAAYMDHDGNAPQVGDNDSGRILIFHESDEHDHSYLLDLGEHIFDYNFKTQCKKKNINYSKQLPVIIKKKTDELNVIPRETSNTIVFKNGGAYFFKNEIYSLMVTIFPVGQNGQGGHNHIDTGSFTLSANGFPLVIDPGTYTYTRCKRERAMFRSMSYHNTIEVNEVIAENNPYWGLKKYFDILYINVNENQLSSKALCNENKKTIQRKFDLNMNSLYISDFYNGNIKSRIHFNPEFSMHFDRENKNVVSVNDCCELLVHQGVIEFEDYYYSSSYGKKMISKGILINGFNEINYCIKIKNQMFTSAEFGIIQRN